MKKITCLLLILPLLLLSCSNNDSTTDDSTPQFAMTATINGKSFQANNPFGGNQYSETNLWSYFPVEDYILIQGRQGGVFGNPEINIWLKKSDIVVGVYAISEETYNTPPSHFIDLTDNSNDTFEVTKSGTIKITEVNTSTKIVEGTFEFITVNSVSNQNEPINNTITNGTFRYKYAN
ncbi:hypothetical protein [Flavobacterium sp. PL002]|uniref:hypothetical protein n=1 Tax=Flavobacterium sp. PL002 TaxID=1897058 RepID=UPI0017879226|nr:hypothetical protein [Flavobacterium sp. PL002]MBE0393576.1 hypothetical protein [Flavobacterium sp. PL002]